MTDREPFRLCSRSLASLSIPEIGEPIDSDESYSATARRLIAAAGSAPQDDGHGGRFAELRRTIAERAPETIPTGWGGVVVTKHEHPLVEKYLVVDAGRFLAFEKHSRKEEALECTEGTGVLLYRPTGKREVEVLRLTPGTRVSFEPGEEHALLAVTDLVVDLIFLFQPQS
jgi:quercetin dioxygenase-like cupin family protein